MKLAGLRWRNREILKRIRQKYLLRHRVTALAVGWAVSICLLALVISWFRPLPPVQLRVHLLSLTSTDNPLNADAATDPDLFLLRSLNGASVRSTPLTHRGLEELHDQLRKPRSRSRFLSSSTTVDVVYVAAAGVASGEEDSPPVFYSGNAVDGPAANAGSLLWQPQASVQLNELLDAVAHSPADCLLLVFDCQKADINFQAGVCGNAFARRAMEILKKKQGEPGFENVYVLLSCDGNQISWPTHPLGPSVFCQCFTDALSGAADRSPDDGGNNDGAVSLAELSSYLTRRVSDWVRSCRNDFQQPPAAFALTAPNDSTADLRSILLSKPADSDIAATDVAETSLPVTQTADANATVEPARRLADAWTLVYTIEKSELPVADSFPVAWNLVQELLLEAEAQFRIGNDAAMVTLADNAEQLLRQTLESQRNLHAGSAGYSLPLRNYLRKPKADSSAAEPGEEPEAAAAAATTAAAASDATAAPAVEAAAKTAAAVEADSSGKPPAGSTDSAPGSSENHSAPGTTDTAVAQTTNTAGGEQSGKSAAATVDQKTTDAALESVIGLSASGRIQEAVEQLRGLKAAAEPQLQSVAFLQLLAAASEGTGSMDWDAARNVLESRQAIEESIFSAGLLTPLASSTMRRVVEAADLIQRQQEDAVLAAGQIRLSTATGTPKSLELQSENLVQVVAEIVSAVRTRDRWIQRAPFLLRLACVRSPLHSTEQTLTPEWIRRTLQSALQEITELDRLLRQTAAEAELAVSAPQRQAVERIVQALQQKELLLDGLLQREADALSRLPDMAPGEGELQSGMAGAHWRQLDQFLMLPFLADRAMEPNAAAARRVRFLQDLIRIQRLTDNFDAVSSGADVSHPPENRRPESLLTLGLSYYATAALPGGTPGLSSECPASGAVLQRLIQDRVAAITQLAHGESATQRVDQLVNVGESLRLFPAHLAQHLFKITQQFPSYRSRELLTADLHLWLAQRISDDFWGIPLGDGEFWFHAVAKECLRSACRHAVGMSGFLEKAEADLQRRLQAAQDFPGLRSSPLRVSLSESRLVGSDQIRALLEVNPAARLPSGNLRLSLRSPADNGLTFNTSLLTEGEREQAEILITRGRPVALSTPVTIHAFLRGHQSFVPLNFSAVGEVDRPGISWQANHATGGELVVNWSKVTPKPMTILFVLDCSRSMNAEGRITILRDSLLRFSDYARHTGVRVGLRVFGDSAVWRIGDRESELKARKDSRLLVPVQPFPEQQFRTSVASLRAFGETPLFHAIQESIQDFPAAERGEKMIVVVSDGADNWAGTPGAPTLANLAEQLTSNSIQCNAIGFRTDAVGFDQLSQLASLTNGMAVRAEDGGQLIQQIMGMTEALECSVYQRNGTQRIRVQQRSLESETVFHVDAGDLIYDLEVTDYSDHVKAVHTGIRMRPGQRHSLNWNGATLAYAAPPLAQDVVFTEHPGNGMLLRVMKTETLPGNRLRLNIALQNRLQPDWWPVDARIVVRPNNSNHLYVLRTLPQNLAGCHFPAWDVTLEHWPADSQSAQIIANWSGQNADPKTHPVQALPLTDALSAPIALDELSHITRASAGLLSWNSSPSPVARITVVNRTSPDAVLGWGVRTDDPPDSVWSVHDTADGLSAIILRFAPGDSPKSFNVLPPLPDDPDHTLQLSLQLKLQQIN